MALGVAHWNINHKMRIAITNAITNTSAIFSSSSPVPGRSGAYALGRRRGVPGCAVAVPPSLMRDLNRLHVENAALHELDFVAEGFSWIDCHDSEQSVVSWLRFARDGSFVVVVCNFTPVPRHGYRIGVPQTGTYRELLNTDSEYYGGSNLGNGNGLSASASPWMNRPASLRLNLPPLAVVVLAP